MTKNDKKLELTWYNKDKSLYYDVDTGNYEWVDKKDPRVIEPRIFLQKKTFEDTNTENMLIKGDNLLALRSFLQDFQNKIKLIYIDPPYLFSAPSFFRSFFPLRERNSGLPPKV